MPEIIRVSKAVLITSGVFNLWLYPRPDWIMAWFCRAGIGSGKWGFCTWQPILCYGKDPYLVNGLGRQHDSIESCEIAEKNNHPCPKPLKLWTKLLLRGSIKESDTIYDPFMGSGTTALVAIKTNRNFIGSEISQTYVDLANKRIDQHLRQEKLAL